MGHCLQVARFCLMAHSCPTARSYLTGHCCPIELWATTRFVCNRFLNYFNRDYQIWRSQSSNQCLGTAEMDRTNAMFIQDRPERSTVTTNQLFAMLASRLAVSKLSAQEEEEVVAFLL